MNRNSFKLKIVQQNQKGESVEGKIFNEERTRLTMMELKAMIAQNFPILKGNDFTMGFIDEDRDFIRLDTDEEVECAVAEAVKASELKIHVKPKKGKQGSADLKIQFPRRYYNSIINLNQLVKKKPDSVIYHNCQSLDRLINFVRRQPGICFVGGNANDIAAKLKLINLVRRQPGICFVGGNAN